MKKNTFSIIDEDGNEITYDVLFTFDSEETNKSYIVYTDNKKDDDNNIQVYASTYDSSFKSNALGEIETEKEWSVIETILKTLQEEIKSKNSTE